MIECDMCQTDRPQTGPYPAEFQTIANDGTPCRNVCEYHLRLLVMTYGGKYKRLRTSNFTNDEKWVKQWIAFVFDLAEEHCIGAYRSITTGQLTGCGRCPTCRARKLTGDILPPPFKTMCRSCGLTGPIENK